MAAGASRGYCHIDVELGRQPIWVPRFMASTAICRGCHVIGSLAGRRRTIVASTTVCETRVIDLGAGPCGRRFVAGFAGCRSRDVVGRLGC